VFLKNKAFIKISDARSDWNTKMLWYFCWSVYKVRSSYVLSFLFPVTLRSSPLIADYILVLFWLLNFNQVCQFVLDCAVLMQCVYLKIWFYYWPIDPLWHIKMSLIRVIIALANALVLLYCLGINCANADIWFIGFIFFLRNQIEIPEFMLTFSMKINFKVMNIFNFCRNHR